MYSTTLESVSSAKTRIEGTFDPDAVRSLKAEADHDLTVDGPNLAAQAIAAGLVDEYHRLDVKVDSCGSHTSRTDGSLAGSGFGWSGPRAASWVGRVASAAQGLVAVG